jgi:hypothetical protein
MAKKASGKHYTSSGFHSNVDSSIRKANRKDYLTSAQRVINQLKAHNKGKRVMITIANPNKEETNKRYLRVPASTIWKDPKDTKNKFIMS